MANEEHLRLLQQGVAQWNTWREQQQEIQPDLSRAYLRDVILSGANLRSAILNDANLRGAILNDAILNDAILNDAILNDAILNDAHLRGAIMRNAYMSFANLSGADLTGASLRGTSLIDANLSLANLNLADLSHANLSGANLSSSDLRDADLRGTVLNETNLNDADLSRARVSQTVFAALNLRNTKGLVEIQHNGPSSVTLNTIQLPQDGSALHFLRGAGLTDEWIDFWRSIMTHPIQYHSLFVSYSSKDAILARRLHADLQDHGVRCWFAPEDMKIGDEIRSRVDEAIHLQEKLLLLLSEHSLTSTWVKNEVEAAFEKEEKQQRLVLFPIRLDESVEQTTTSWAATLRRTRHIGDFTCWTDPQKYQQAFERLLRDLKKADEQQNQERKQ